ncbi:DUF4189 domain-containing protein [Paraburkholderia sp. J8-2]|uniref:DUF4189 domain-containing protein n=1 Tax=Paraburkholderia sp. J8-2 TaxID=2805440 RepID=UPI002AB6081F|nr:DUF4189 domain-containing protein [Paraburkholderia sp. J8-2]
MKANLVKGFFAATAMLAGVHAHAWEATATDSINKPYIAYNIASPKEAQFEALKLCADAGRSECHLVGKPVDKTAIVFARGDSAGTSAAKADPMTAASVALAGCSRLTTHCRIVAAVWDEGATWTVMAKSPEYFAFGQGSTPEEADAAGLADCRKNSKTSASSCKVIDSPGEGHRYFVRVVGTNGTGTFAGASTKEAATELAIAGCAKKYGGDKSSCTIDPKFGIEVGTPTSAPESMKKVTAMVQPD